jgi:MFS family permease
MSAAPSVRTAAVQPGEQTDTRKGRWASLTAMALAFTTDNSESGLINILFPAIRNALGLELGALGLMTSMSRFSRMLFGPLWAMIGDKYGRKRVLVIASGLWSVWTILAGLSQNFTQLLILYGIAVIGTVASEPIANGLLADLFEDEERGKAYGAIRSVGTFAGLLITPALGIFANIENGWRYGMFVIGAINILAGILVLFMVKEPKRRTVARAHEEGEFSVAKIKLLVKTPTVLLLAGNLLFVTSLVLFAFMVVYFVDVRGWDNASAVYIYTVFMAGFAISSFLGGFLGDRFDKRFGPKGRVMLMQLYLITFAVMSFVALQVDWGQGMTIYVLMFLFGLIGSIGFSGCVLPMVAAVVPPELSATAFALLFSLVQGLISALMSLGLGYAAQAWGLPTVMFWLITVPYAINATYWFLFYRVYPRDVAAQQARVAATTSA